MYLSKPLRKGSFSLMNLRHLSVWMVVWGNLAGFLDYTLLHFNVYSVNSSSHLRIYFFTAILALLLSNKLIPRIDNQGSFISELVKLKSYNR